MINFKQLFCWHRWVHVSRGFGGGTTSYYQECKKCDKRKPDPEMKRFAQFVDAGRAQGLSTEDMRAIIRSGKSGIL